MKPTTDDQLCMNSIYVSILSICISVLLLVGEHSYWEDFMSWETSAETTVFVLSIVFLTLASVAALLVLGFGIVRIVKKESLKTVVPFTCMSFFQLLFLLLNAHAVSYMGYLMSDDGLGYIADRFSDGAPRQGLTITLAVFAVLDIILACVFLSMLKSGTLTDTFTPARISESLKSQADAYNAAKTAPKTDDKFCPYCGAKLTSSGKFCTNCGKDVSAFHEEEPKFFCPGCGTAIKKYSAYCPNCGYDLSSLKDKMNVSSGPEAEEKTSE